MTTEEMIAELEIALAASENPDGFYSTREYGDLLGLGADAVRRRLRVLQNLGRLEHRRVRRPNDLGGGSSVKDCYRILPG